MVKGKGGPDLFLKSMESERCPMRSGGFVCWVGGRGGGGGGGYGYQWRRGIGAWGVN